MTVVEPIPTTGLLSFVFRGQEMQSGRDEITGFSLLETTESLKAVATAASGRGTFWTSGEHFGPKFTQFG